MELTKAQRYECYKYAYKNIEAHVYMCNACKYKAEKFLNTVCLLIPDYTFPELMAKKPERTFTTNVWFPTEDTKSRKEILKQCMEETKP